MDMSDQIVDGGAAQGLQTYADRSYPMVGWVVMQGLLAHPGKIVARLVTDNDTSFLLTADTLEDLRRDLPVGLNRSDRQTTDAPEIVEFWFSSWSSLALNVSVIDDVAQPGARLHAHHQWPPRWRPSPSGPGRATSFRNPVNDHTSANEKLIALANASKWRRGSTLEN
jgi:hypothetical protein